MSYQVAKPFFDAAAGDVLQVGDSFETTDDSRARDLLHAGLIVVKQKQIIAAPFNKDAGPQRKNKHK